MGRGVMGAAREKKRKNVIKERDGKGKEGIPAEVSGDKIYA